VSCYYYYYALAKKKDFDFIFEKPKGIFVAKNKKDWKDSKCISEFKPYPLVLAMPKMEGVIIGTSI
jgi:hypothetical protein